MHRRGFLQRAGLVTVAMAWAGGSATSRSTRAAVAVSPKPFPVIDPHTHFYDPTRAEGVPWPPATEKRLYRTVLPRDYPHRSLPFPVGGTVVVEASPWVEDNQWVLDLAEREPFLVGLVGSLPVGTPEFAAQLRRFAANRLFRGIRLRDRKLDGALADASFVRDLKLLAEHELSLDLVGGLEILTFAAQLAEVVPDLRIVIDHLAGVRVDGQEPPAEWQRKMRALASRTKVFFKLSGLVEGTGRSDGSAPSEAAYYRPVLDAMWGMFGPERLLYASNWPVCELFAPLPTVQAIVAEYCRGKGAAAEARVFGGTARAAYRWVERKPVLGAGGHSSDTR